MSNSGCSRREFLRGAFALASIGICASGARSDGAPISVKPAKPAGPIYPDDAFSRPTIDRLSAFATLCGCSIAGGVFDRASHFTQSELKLTGSRALWSFTPRDVDRASIIVDERIRRRPEDISFRVRNDSAEPITITMDVNELCWHPVRENLAVNWTLGPGHQLRPGEDKTLRFQFSEARCTTKTERPEPHYPLFGIVLSASQLKTGVAYDLILSDLTVHYRQARDVQLDQLDCPASATAGKKLTLGLTAQGSIAGRKLDLELRRDPSVLWRIRLTSNEIAALAHGACQVERTVPSHIPSGPYTIGLVADGYRVEGAQSALKITNSTAPNMPKAERRLHNGRATFFLDGKPRVWQGYASYDYQPGSVSEFGASGTNVFCVSACAGRHIHNICGPTMVAPGRFDYDSLDQRVSFSLESNPDALIFLRVSLALPHCWTDKHPDELAKVQTDLGPLAWEETGSPAASLASEAWRRDQSEALRDLIRHCKAQPWSKRLAGVLLTGEVTEEWFAWGCNDGFYSDYSAPNQKRFADWLTKQGKPAQPIPSPTARKRPGCDIYPDDDTSRLAAAYHQYYSELTAQTLGYFADIVKRETESRCLVGAFYGYVIQLAGEPRQVIAGHSALRRVIDDPNIDFIAGIPLLDFRDLTNGYDPYTSATESILAAGKLFCNENDMFSWLHPIVWHTEFDPADPRAGAISMHRRACASDAVHGVVSQKFSLMASWHHDAQLQADFTRQAKVNSRALDFDRTPAEQIAFVVDESSLDWTPPESALLNAAHKQLLKCLGRTGAPVGVWLLSDLDKLPDRIKLVVIAHAAAAQPEDLTKLSALLAKGGRTLLVVGPIGLVDRPSGKWRPNAPADILGLPIHVTDKLDISGDKTERDLPNGGRLIWSGTPPLSTEQLRPWIERAGVHCYAPIGSFVHASRELVSITSPVKAEVVLRWPEKCSIVDLFDGWAGTGIDITCPFAAGQTRLFARKRA